MRVFNVAINASRCSRISTSTPPPAATSKPSVRDFPATADGNGNVVIVYTTLKDNAKSSCVEVLSPPLQRQPPAAPVALSAADIAPVPSTDSGCRPEHRHRASIRASIPPRR